MKCTLCKRTFIDGVVKAGFMYCSEDHAQKDWFEDKADRFAHIKSGGKFHDYEDYMEHEYGILSYSEDDNYIFDRGY